MPALDINMYEAKLARLTEKILTEAQNVSFMGKKSIGNLMCQCSGVIPRANQVAKGDGDIRIRSLIYGHSLDLTECAKKLGMAYKRTTGELFNYDKHVDEFGYQPIKEKEWNLRR